MKDGSGNGETEPGGERPPDPVGEQGQGGGEVRAGGGGRAIVEEVAREGRDIEALDDADAGRTLRSVANGHRFQEGGPVLVERGGPSGSEVELKPGVDQGFPPEARERRRDHE